MRHLQFLNRAPKMKARDSLILKQVFNLKFVKSVLVFHKLSLPLRFIIFIIWFKTYCKKLLVKSNGLTLDLWSIIGYNDSVDRLKIDSLSHRVLKEENLDDVRRGGERESDVQSGAAQHSHYALHCT